MKTTKQNLNKFYTLKYKPAKALLKALKTMKEF